VYFNALILKIDLKLATMQPLNRNVSLIFLDLVVQSCLCSYMLRLAKTVQSYYLLQKFSS